MEHHCIKEGVIMEIQTNVKTNTKNIDILFFKVDRLPIWATFLIAALSTAIGILASH